jgi:sortase A
MAFPRSKLLALFITLVAGALFFSTLFSSTLYSSQSEVTDEALAPTTTVSHAAPVVAGAPERIRIPKIGIDAKIEHVGLGKTGNMAVPLQYADAGWYRQGTVPGEVGSAVIDGHVDNGLGIPAVFFRLSELKAGDDIYVTDGQGDELHFVVEEEATYAVADVPLETLFNRADKARLNLITCEGTWLPEKKMYDERHVVYAVLVA